MKFSNTLTHHRFATSTVVSFPTSYQRGFTFNLSSTLSTKQLKMSIVITKTFTLTAKELFHGVYSFFLLITCKYIYILDAHMYDLHIMYVSWNSSDDVSESFNKPRIHHFMSSFTYSLSKGKKRQTKNKKHGFEASFIYTYHQLLLNPASAFSTTVQRYNLCYYEMSLF